MEGGHRGTDAEFRADQTHATDATRSSTKQGHDGIDAEQSAGPEANDQARQHQRKGDQNRWFPQNLQLFQRRSRQAGADHGADPDLKNRPRSRWPCGWFQLAAHADDASTQEGPRQRCSGNAAEQGQQSDGGSSQGKAPASPMKASVSIASCQLDLETAALLCCHRHTTSFSVMTSSVSFRITRTAEDLAQTITALSQRLVKLEQRQEVLELQLRQQQKDLNAVPDDEIATLEGVEVLLRETRELLESTAPMSEAAASEESSHNDSWGQEDGTEVSCDVA